MEGIAYALLFAIGLAIYFLPTLVGWKKKNVIAIFTLNLLLGWSVIGWVIALVWAVAKDTGTPTVNVHSTNQP